MDFKRRRRRQSKSTGHRAPFGYGFVIPPLPPCNVRLESIEIDQSFYWVAVQACGIQACSSDWVIRASYYTSRAGYLVTDMASCIMIHCSVEPGMRYGCLDRCTAASRVALRDSEWSSLPLMPEAKDGPVSSEASFVGGPLLLKRQQYSKWRCTQITRTFACFALETNVRQFLPAHLKVLCSSFSTLTWQYPTVLEADVGPYTAYDESVKRTTAGWPSGIVSIWSRSDFLMEFPPT